MDEQRQDLLSESTLMTGETRRFRNFAPFVRLRRNLRLQLQALFRSPQRSERASTRTQRNTGSTPDLGPTPSPLQRNFLRERERSERARVNVKSNINVNISLPKLFTSLLSALRPPLSPLPIGG